MLQPQPGQLHGCASGARIAGLADALVAIGAATLPWTGCQPEIARNLAPIVEVLIKYFSAQRRRECRAKAFEALQEFAAPGHLCRRRLRRIRCSRCRRECIE